MQHSSDYHDPFHPYQDAPRTGGSPNQVVDYELQDYYDDTGIPPPHRLSGYAGGHSYSPERGGSPSETHTPSDAHYRGAYTQPTASYPTADEPFMPPLNPEYAFEGSSGNRGWLEKQQSNKKRNRWLIIGAVVGLVGLIIIGVAVGVSVGKKKSSSSDASSPVKQTNPNDPSTFTKDPNLKQSFYGLAYTPEGVQLPECGAKLSDVITDIQLMSQLTTRIRLYGADCNQSALVLDAIQQTKVNMTVWLGNYAVPNDNGTAYDRQRDVIKEALQTFGTTHIGGVTVGNEFMLNYLDENGATDPNSAVGNTGAALLTADIDDTRSMITALNLSSHVPVGTADAGAYFNTIVMEDIEYGMSNVHPWFANVSIDQAAAWTADFFNTNNVQPAAQLSNAPQMYIAETGWPTQSSDVSNESNGPSTASEANLQTFMNDFVCQANANGTGYFFFEYFDEPWKDKQFGGVEGWWGLFHSNRTLKNIEIPSCSS